MIRVVDASASLDALSVRGHPTDQRHTPAR
jgi:hypothetical protein